MWVGGVEWWVGVGGVGWWVVVEMWVMGGWYVMVCVRKVDGVGEAEGVVVGVCGRGERGCGFSCMGRRMRVCTGHRELYQRILERYIHDTRAIRTKELSVVCTGTTCVDRLHDLGRITPPKTRRARLNR